MASKSTIVRDTVGEIVVRVDHLDTDSFSRSVDRAATRALHRANSRYTVSHTVGSYAFTGLNRKCVSMIAYARSFDECERLLDEERAAAL